ncbi:MAG: hypothetical protein AABY43_06045 [Candidatus Omnitrophota bacterium]
MSEFFLLPAFFCVVLAIILAPLASAEDSLIYKAGGKRDPMIPLVTPQGLIRDIKSQSAQHEGLSLEGIIYDAQRNSLAIINGEILKAGDNIGEVKILDIQEDRVMILKDNEVQEIRLEEEGE